MHAVGEKMLKVHAVVFQSVEERRDLDSAQRLVQIASVQGFNEDHQDIGGSGEPLTGPSCRSTHQGIVREGKHRLWIDDRLCGPNGFRHRHFTEHVVLAGRPVSIQRGAQPFARVQHRILRKRIVRRTVDVGRPNCLGAPVMEPRQADGQCEQEQEIGHQHPAIG